MRALSRSSLETFSPKVVKTLPVASQAIILHALIDVRGSIEIRDTIARQLLAQIKTLLVSASLRDTFLALRGLAVHNTALISGELLADIVQRLLSAEIAVGGPYADTSGRLDITANISIDAFMKQLGKPLPRVEQFLKRQPRVYDAVTIATRSFACRERVDILATPAILVAFNLATQCSSSAVRLEKSFQAEAEKVLAYADSMFRELAEPLRANSRAMLRGFVKADTNHEVTLLALFFQQSLTHTTLPPKLWCRLGAANLFYWIAYLAYDDLLDEDSGPGKLLAANVCMRRSLDIYRQALPRSASPKIVARVFDNTEAVNAWELNYCRFKTTKTSITISQIPAYNQGFKLARRAFGHALGPNIIAMHAGYSSAKIKLLERAWTHFLIARQLNDDLHDWMEDVTKGHISFVVADMLRALHMKPGVYSIKAVKYDMQVYFWRQGLEHFAQLILQHISQAKQCFRQVPGLVPSDELLMLYDRIENAVKAALTRHRDEKQFIAQYKNQTFKT